MGSGGKISQYGTAFFIKGPSCLQHLIQQFLKGEATEMVLVIYCLTFTGILSSRRVLTWLYLVVYVNQDLYWCVISENKDDFFQSFLVDHI